MHELSTNNIHITDYSDGCSVALDGKDYWISKSYEMKDIIVDILKTLGCDVTVEGSN